MEYIAQIAKSLGGFAAPWIAKGIGAVVALLGVTDVSSVQIDNTSTLIVSLVVGAIVWALPNKEKPVA